MSNDFANVRGLSELEDALALLPRELQNKYLAQGMSAGAKVIQDEIKQRAPVRTDGELKRLSKKSSRGRLPGYLKASVIRQLVHDGNTHGMTYRVGFGKKAFYAAFYELGTRHQAARPFMRPAVEASANHAVFQVGEIIGKLIDKFAASRPKIS
jgi:HK97 gp10 family phage protein